MITKQHYDALAREFNRHMPAPCSLCKRYHKGDAAYRVWNEMVVGVCDILGQMNPNFKSSTFLSACRKEPS